jgi:hypothetical protein
MVHIDYPDGRTETWPRLARRADVDGYAEANGFTLVIAG